MTQPVLVIHPGQVMKTFANKTAVNVPVYPNYSWFDFDNLDSIPRLFSGAYYIGIKWNPSLYPNHFLGVDESSSTPSWHIFTSSNSGSWTDLRTYMPLANAVGIRADNSGFVLTHDYSPGPFLGLPCRLIINNLINIRGRIRNLGSSNENSVPVKFFVDGAQVGASLNLSLLAGQIDSVSFPWIPSAGGLHEIRIVTSLSTDQNRYNDTLKSSIQVLAGSPIIGEVYNGCRNGLNILIPDNGFVFDSILVTAPSNAYLITSAKVKIDSLFHPRDSDLRLYLLHLDKQVIFIDSVGGSGHNFIGTQISDTACYSFSSGYAPFTGSFTPSNPLSILNAYVNPSGYWKLKLVDTVSGSSGTLKAWCLTVTYLVWEGGIKSLSIPNYYALKQNYPNPFNPSTKIEYAIPRPGDTKITVYDILGRQVAMLVDEFKNPGIYSVDFDASQLSSGVYFYKMESGKFTDTKKMLIVK